MKENGPPAKLLWYLPIIPRLKRLFTNEKDAKLLRWHAEDRKNDGKMRHVADSLQWKNFDKDFKEFGDEIRNIKFGLSSDGINSFGDLSSRHSTWPVLLCIYNLPPSLCMKRKYIMMSLLIQGPKQLGNDIDVYLQPLVDEIMELWSTSIHVYDAYKKEYFQLRAMLFCTINDFPAYGNLSGYSTNGKKACPICEENTHSIWLTNYKKLAFMGHRRELAENHPYRKKSDVFDGTIEDRKLPPPLDGETTLSNVANINVVLGKKRFGSPKDGIKVRRDMELMNIRPELQPKDIDGRSTKFLPPACYTMSKVEKTKSCQCLHGIKVPSGYSANIRKLVLMKDLKLLSMKSHDSHVLMTQMIPIAIRGILPNQWLKDKVRRTLPNIDKTVEALGFAPKHVFQYQGYDINGYTFYTKAQDKKSKMQNSGVTVIASSTEFTMVNHEERSRITKKSYYGVIHEIWELDYGNSYTIPLFKCKWVDNDRGIQVDKDGFTTVNLSTNGYKEEPFILAKLVTQVFFIEDPKDSRWHVVQYGKRRIVGVKNVVDEDEYDQFDELQPFSVGVQPLNEVVVGNNTIYVRGDHEEGDEVAGT
ncbi:uncharacterized protein [Rutidosis leptorrhynchoides]|uniref:uncharacterized protein n=1 Tax=Rutidosis leptorrhynchoides TaxID=125765 RepID=UPI003A98EFCE